MFSLNTFVSILNTLAKAHEQIMSFGEGDVWEIGVSNTIYKQPAWAIPAASNTVAYPLMWVVPNGFTTKGATDGAWEAMTKYSLVFADIVYEDKSNEQDVLSDTQQIAFDILAQLKGVGNESQNYGTADNFELDPAIQFTNFTEKFDDLTAGWKVDIIIRINYLADRCAVPSTIIPDGQSGIIIPDFDDGIERLGQILLRGDV